MKTLTLLGCTTCLAASLSGCGTDPLVLGELLVTTDEASASPGDGDAYPSPEEPATSEPEAPDVEEPQPGAPELDEPEAPELDALEEEVSSILRVNCGVCHSGPDALFFDYIEDIDRMIETSMIVPGDREQSRIYVRMAAGTMPPFADGQRPTPEEIELVGQFIDELE